MARICPNVPSELVDVSFKCAHFAETKSSKELGEGNCLPEGQSVPFGTVLLSFSLWIVLSPFFRACCSYLRGELFPEGNVGTGKALSIWQCSVLIGQARTLLLEVHGDDLRCGNMLFNALDDELKEEWQPSALGMPVTLDIAKLQDDGV